MPFEFVTAWLSESPVAIRLIVIAAIAAALVLARYFLIAGTGFGVTLLLERFAPWRRLQRMPFTRKQILREITHSVLSVLVFMGVSASIIVLDRTGYAQLYHQADAYGWLWFWLQIPVVLLIQDWYFYWMHRIVHTDRFYNHVHKTHHLSTNPSPFAALAFHPFEAFLEIAIFVILILIIPLHVTAILAAGVLSLVYNVYGHMGYEIMPRFIANSPLGYWLNKSAYHNQHHRTYRYNYGLYTVIWDRLHGTMHPHADRLYDKATTKPVPKEKSGNRETG